MEPVKICGKKIRVGKIVLVPVLGRLLNLFHLCCIVLLMLMVKKSLSFGVALW